MALQKRILIIVAQLPLRTVSAAQIWTLSESTMAPPGSRWWQAPDEGDLDYGFDSDDLDARFAQPERNPRQVLPRDRGATDEDAERERDTPNPEEKGVLGNMASWLHRQAGSSNNQLATTAVLSGAAVAGAIFGYQAYKRNEAVHDLKASIPVLNEAHHAEKVRLPSSFCGRLPDSKFAIRGTER
jgi:hypothetical protein